MVSSLGLATDPFLERVRTASRDGRNTRGRPREREAERVSGVFRLAAAFGHREQGRMRAGALTDPFCTDEIQGNRDELDSD